MRYNFDPIENEKQCVENGLREKVTRDELRHYIGNEREYEETLEMLLDVLNGNWDIGDVLDEIEQENEEPDCLHGYEDGICKTCGWVKE